MHGDVADHVTERDLKSTQIHTYSYCVPPLFTSTPAPPDDSIAPGLAVLSFKILTRMKW
jgi:hypothetical protein